MVFSESPRQFRKTRRATLTATNELKTAAGKEPIWVAHALFFPLCPVLAIYATNLASVSGKELLLPLTLSIALSLLVYVLARLSTRSKSKAGLICALFWALFFSWRQCFRLAYDLKITELGISLQAGSVIFGAFLFFLGTILILKHEKHLRWINTFLSIASGLALCLISYNIVSSLSTLTGKIPAPSPVPFISAAKGDKQPDVFYIILDAYGRHDVLNQIYGIDNSSFLESLKKLGFYIADRSTSNYCQTLQSLNASLGMEYLDNLAKDAGIQNSSRSPLQNNLRASKSIASFRNAGYSFVSFSSGYSGTEMPYADVYIPAPGTLSEFHQILLSRSPIPAFLAISPIAALRNWQFKAHRNRVTFILDSLKNFPVANDTKPRFVLAHMLSPHPPFVFAADGSEVNHSSAFSFGDGSHYINGQNLEKYLKGYAGQVAWLNARLIESLSELVKNNPDAIIVVQGDHGPGSRLDWQESNRTDVHERFSILNAYRLPEAAKKSLYPAISPVNSFRLIFREVFEAQIELLADESYYSTWDFPYRYIKVSERTSETRAPDQLISDVSNQSEF